MSYKQKYNSTFPIFRFHFPISYFFPFPGFPFFHFPYHIIFYPSPAFAFTFSISVFLIFLYNFHLIRFFPLESFRFSTSRRQKIPWKIPRKFYGNYLDSIEIVLTFPLQIQTCNGHRKILANTLISLPLTMVDFGRS